MEVDVYMCLYVHYNAFWEDIKSMEGSWVCLTVYSICVCNRWLSERAFVFVHLHAWILISQPENTIEINHLVSYINAAHTMYHKIAYYISLMHFSYTPSFAIVHNHQVCGPRILYFWNYQILYLVKQHFYLFSKINNFYCTSLRGFDALIYLFNSKIFACLISCELKKNGKTVLCVHQLIGQLIIPNLANELSTNGITRTLSST